jgi:hypothetical protein
LAFVEEKYPDENEEADDTPIRSQTGAARRAVARKKKLIILAVAGGVAALLMVIAGVLLISRGRDTIASSKESSQTTRVGPPSFIPPLRADPDPAAPSTHLPPVRPTASPVVPIVPVIVADPRVVSIKRIAKNPWWGTTDEGKIGQILERLATANNIIIVYDPKGTWGEVTAKGIVNSSGSYIFDLWSHIESENILTDGLKGIDLNYEKADTRPIVVGSTARRRTIEECELLLEESLRSKLSRQDYARWVKKAQESIKPVPDK